MLVTADKCFPISEFPLCSWISMLISCLRPPDVLKSWSRKPGQTQVLLVLRTARCLPHLKDGAV